MFDNLSDKLNTVFKKLKGHGKLSENNIEDGLKEVRIALLEADVHYKVVKKFISEIKERALGQEVMSSLTPGQQVIKIVNEELTDLMGSMHKELNFSESNLSSIMFVGLQGSGKTTSVGKIALLLTKKGRKPFLVPADVYRPAAISQLKKIGQQICVPVFPSDPQMSPVNICREALKEAQQKGYDTLLLDTAGRLHIDDELMDELRQIKQTIHPVEILLVADAMTGQDAVNIATSFDNVLDISGVVLTKMDGDARGGAALSIHAVSGKPVKYIGTGEKPEDIEPFYPDRLSSRILGMGDVLTFIEKAQSVVDEKKAAELESKIRKNSFTLDDFRYQMVQIRKIGSLDELLGMIPGVGNNKQLKKLKVDENEFVKIEAMINSMTLEERSKYTIINGSRRKRIAMGSGTQVQDVNKLLKNYAHVMKMMKKLNKGGMRGLKRGMLPI